MPTLLLMRHAKSSWKHPGRPDHDRPLNGRGKRTADAMGQWLADTPHAPEVIVSSTARRARKTAKRLARQLRPAPRIQVDERLYAANVDDCLNVLQGISRELHRVMLIGHNPTLEDLVEDLTGCNETLPTASIALIDLRTEWQHVQDGRSASLIAVWRPSEVLRSDDVPQASSRNGVTMPVQDE